MATRNVTLIIMQMICTMRVMTVVPIDIAVTALAMTGVTGIPVPMFVRNTTSTVVLGTALPATTYCYLFFFVVVAGVGDGGGGCY